MELFRSAQTAKRGMSTGIGVVIVNGVRLHDARYHDVHHRDIRLPRPNTGKYSRTASWLPRKALKKILLMTFSFSTPFVLVEIAQRSCIRQVPGGMDFYIVSHLLYFPPEKIELLAKVHPQVGRRSIIPCGNENGGDKGFHAARKT